MALEPLRDINVVDFTQALAGPMATTLLADLGADVVKIEPPGGASQRHINDGSIRPNVMRNKRSLAVDLKRSESADLLEPLIERADVVIHNYAPGTMDRLGYDYESVRAINEDVVYVSLTGFGDTGPYSDQKGFDSLAAAMSGLLWNTGEPDRKPSKIGGNTIDVGTGFLTAFAIMAGLWDRAREGTGQKIETSLFEMAATTVMDHYTRYSRTGETPTRQGHTLDTVQPIGMFHTADDPIWLTCPYQSLWETLCSTLDRDDWIDEPAFETLDDRVENRDELHRCLEDEFAEYSRDELVSTLIDAGVPCGEVQTIAEAAHDDHLRARETVVEVDDVDGERVLTAATPIHFDSDTPPVDESPPEVSAHARRILADLGFSDAEIESYIDREIVAQPPAE
jgi:crotonobetainyl-CoA:carnitine CoA-transferase CaiB-like acyl-CoA transferase